MKYAKHITDLIGNTPLVKIIKFSKKVKVFFWLKSNHLIQDTQLKIELEKYDRRCRKKRTSQRRRNGD